MSRTRIVKGKITKITGGNYNIYSKGNIENIGSKVIQVGKEFGVSYGDSDPFPPTPILAKALVHIRPGKDWMGKGYGFDWMRTREDSGIRKMPYIDIVSKQHIRSYPAKNPSELEMAQNEFEGIFTLDNKQYEKLKREYPYYSVDWKNKGEEKGEYFGSWLSLYPANIENENGELIASNFTNTKAVLTLKTEIKEKPEKFIIKENPYFDISPMEFTSEQTEEKEDFLTIKCIKEFSQNQSIRIYTLKDGMQLPCGELKIFANDKSKRKEIEVVLVEVTTPPISIREPKEGKFTNEIEILDTFLKQALISIKPNSEIISLDLTKEDKIEKTKEYIEEKHLLKHRKTDQLPIDRFLSYHLGKEYDNKFKIFILGEEFKSEKLGKTVAYSEYGAKYLLMTSADDGDKSVVVAHEVLHALGLPHSFTNEEAYRKEPTAISGNMYTYSGRNTENLMDYFEKHKEIPPRHMLWKWQWEMANKGAENFK